MAHLEEVIKVSRQAVQATSDDDPQLIGWLNNLGNELENRYERTGQIDDLEEAIRVSRQAVQATPSNHPEITWLLNSLGNKLGRRYERKRQIGDLEEAIRVYCQAVETTPNDYVNLTWLLSGLGNMLECQYERTEQMNDLEEAIRVSRQAVQATPSNHPEIMWLLNSLGNKLGRRYERRGQIQDLEEAIRLSRQAVQTIPNHHPQLAELLNNLGNKLESRYKRTGRIDDIEEAIRLSRQAVQATPNSHASLTKFLNSLGYQLGYRYERIGQIDDLEEAVLVCRRAFKTTHGDHPNLAVLLNNLGSKLESRYKRKGQMNDLDEAIRYSRQALATTPADHPNLAVLLNSLGNQLGFRYERTAQINDLEEAIRVYRKAINSNSSNHRDFAGLSNNLGSRLESRYERKGQMDDLEEAIRYSRQAVAATPDDHPNLAMYLNNLANILEIRYQRIGQMEDLGEAIRVSRQGIAITPDDHPNLAGSLSNLGAKLGLRYEQTRQIEDLEEATRVSRQAFKTAPSPPLSRITAAILALRLLIEQDNYHAAYTLSVEAIELLKLVHNRFLTLQDRQYVVSHFSGLATQACSLALQTGQSLSEALLLLESGRGVILSLLLDDRSDTSKLKEVHPALCARYESLRLELNTPPKSTISEQPGDFISVRRPKVIEELERCIQDIRDLPDLGSFPRGLSAEQMQTASNEGSIIVVNVTNLRSDAIIISTSGFSLVPLPRFGAVQVQSWVEQKLTSPGERGVKNKLYRQFLAWLWRECVKPALTKLGHSMQSSPEDLPRVWWIGTGLACSFPFHAAGDIFASENTFSRVLSSYTPSIKALLHARERVSVSAPSNETPPKLLMVTMTNTPGADDLPGVKAEKSTVLGVLGNYVHVEVLEQPDSASVIRQIGECNIAHFACHGTSDPDDPSQSGLLLQTATTNPRQDILSVLKLCENHPTLGKIAYLSACSTAENQAERLIDEVLHVVSGFQVAGFRHVIGTLWPSDDSLCVEVARSFYAELCQNGTLECTDRAVAIALHKALSVVATNVDYRKRPLLWAQYVHFGA